MMTSAQAVKTSVTVTDNSPFKDFSHPDDHTTRSTVTPGFKHFTSRLKKIKFAVYSLGPLHPQNAGIFFFLVVVVVFLLLLLLLHFFVVVVVVLLLLLFSCCCFVVVVVVVVVVL